MKITRISDSEKYNTTSPWLADFTNRMIKEGNYLDSVRSRKDINGREKFATIEEKMADIKNRIGFLSGLDSINKEASCNCGSCGSCRSNSEYKTEECSCGVCYDCKRRDALDFIVKVLDYAKGILSESPSMIPEMVVSKCRAEIPHFESYEKYMCPDKLRQSILKMTSPLKQTSFDYIPSSKVFDFSEDEE